MQNVEGFGLATYYICTFDMHYMPKYFTFPPNYLKAVSTCYILKQWISTSFVQ